LRARSRRLVRLVAVVTILSAGFGVAIAGRDRDSLAIGAVSGILIGLALSILEIQLRGPFREIVRRTPMALLLAFRTLAYTATFFLGIHAAYALVHGSWEQFLHPSRLVTNTTLLLSFVFAFAINFGATLGRLLGPRTLLSLLTGRYHRPRQERRIVLFADLRGSTHLAETLGDGRFHRFLNEVFWDITDPVLEAGGEIYRYVGDEIIVTWPAGRARRARWIECMFDMTDALAVRREAYLAAFGTEPQLRGALHAGPLIVGEMGDAKREIVMLGDTMNTVARIETACRALGKDYVVSGEALSLALLPEGVHAERLGPVPLSGKGEPIELYALTRGAR
jgi:adenylate cyclase